MDAPTNFGPMKNFFSNLKTSKSLITKIHAKFIKSMKMKRKRLIYNSIEYNKAIPENFILNYKVESVITKIVYFFHGRSENSMNITNNNFQNIQISEILYLSNSIAKLLSSITGISNLSVFFQNDLYDVNNQTKISGPMVSIDNLDINLNYNKLKEDIFFNLQRGFPQFNDPTNTYITVIFPYTYIKYLITKGISEIIKGSKTSNNLKNISSMYIADKIAKIGANDLYKSFLSGIYISKHVYNMINQIYCYMNYLDINYSKFINSDSDSDEEKLDDIKKIILSKNQNNLNIIQITNTIGEKYKINPHDLLQIITPSEKEVEQFLNIVTNEKTNISYYLSYNKLWNMKLDKEMVFKYIPFIMYLIKYLPFHFYSRFIIADGTTSVVLDKIIEQVKYIIPSITNISKIDISTKKLSKIKEFLKDFNKEYMEYKKEFIIDEKIMYY